MKSAASYDESYRQAVTERLRAIVQDSSITEIHRQTGYPTATIHRFANGAKIPADFFSALTLQLGVSPLWLLTGSGPRYLAQIPNEAEKTGEDVLKLAEAMSTAVTFNLNKLIGPGNVRAVRELRANVRTIQEQRRQLNEITRPTIENLGHELSQATLAHEFEQAEHLCGLLELLTQLNSDPNDVHKIQKAMASYFRHTGDTERAIQTEIEALLHVFPEGEIASHETCEHAGSLAIALYENGRFDDALRVCSTYLEATKGIGDGWASRYALLAISGVPLIETGQVFEGLERLSTARLKLDASWKQPFVDNNVMYAMLLSGAITSDQAQSMKGDPYASIAMIGSYAMWTEQLEDIDCAMNLYTKTLSASSIEAYDFLFTHLRNLRELLSTQSAAKKRRILEKSASTYTKPSKFMLRKVTSLIALAQIARLAQQTRKFSELNQKAHAELMSISPKTSPRFLQRCVHHRNIQLGKSARWSGAEQAMGSAREFFDSQLDSGYGVVSVHQDVLPQ